MHDYSKNSCLLTDFYQFTMAQAYFDQKRHNSEAVFHLFFRKNPFLGNWALVAGISDALDYVSRLHFDQESLDYLAQCTTNNQTRLFSDDFLTFLAKACINVEIYGVKDGETVFPFEPILRIKGPLFLCQILETPLLNIINFQTLIATKASRIVLAANNKPVIDFGLRRAQGFDGAISATKAAYIGGITSTSNVFAARYFGIPPSGTQAHSFVMSYESQQQAFDDFADSFKDSCVLVVDTYDAENGIKDAIRTYMRLTAQGHNPIGIRLDSGDLLDLSKMARRLLDQAGLSLCKIIVSGDLDEHKIDQLEKACAPIDMYGVGTKLITAYDDPALGGVYKLAAIREQGAWRTTFKSAVAKKSLPGPQAIKRFSKNGEAAFDLVFDPTADSLCSIIDGEEQLLHSLLMKQKTPVGKKSLIEVRNDAKKSLSRLPKDVLSLTSTKSYPVYFDDAIAKTRLNLGQNQ